jgi:hypothetical protein
MIGILSIKMMDLDPVAYEFGYRTQVLELWIPELCLSIDSLGTVTFGNEHQPDKDILARIELSSDTECRIRELMRLSQGDRVRVFSQLVDELQVPQFVV